MFINWSEIIDLIDRSVDCGWFSIAKTMPTMMTPTTTATQERNNNNNNDDDEEDA